MRRDRGITLVELMISLALFGLIASGALSLVMSGARTQAHSARVDVAQSGLRAGLDFMTRDLLSASAGARSGGLIVSATGSVLQPVVVVDGGTTGPDTLEIYTIDATYMGTVTMDLAEGDGAIPIALNDATYPFAANDVVQLCDSQLAKGALVQLTAASSTSLTGAVTHFPAGISYLKGSYVFKTRHVKYSIKADQFLGVATASGNTSALMMDLFDGAGGASNPQPLAEGVEDLQVALGVDSNTDGLIGVENGAGGDDDEWVFNHESDTAPVTVANLKSVRITLIAKSSTAERGSFPVRPKAEDRAAAGANDGFFRRVIRTEVAVRNFNL